MNHLLIFARHPELGRVKTRLARTLGDEAALAVYEELLALTRAAANGLAPAHKTVWFAEPALTPGPNRWPDCEQRLQPAGNLGHRMVTAFAQAFASGATAAVIIGTDCPELTTTHLEQAFQQLQTHDVVLGPAEDGGYYLLGMNRLHLLLFANKTWSTDSVLADTVADSQELGLRLALLPKLQDVDTEADLTAWRQKTKR
ncbi:TIGR04282 family arsenosugar biosynthesis glycosyltransferase [Hymenobacter persicinus]|uniref:Glycosyltransferase n=1 Tax=Hymenobacter persicinus TaxID=2025506 RepID=A0A4Q5LB47_9BACT|nr:TIGR04282 family arsenosugar biosynthesis glycosyltransferase [Hymenobacter persicinus]RYU78248.1 glycosyltransferase [Hymenobacter persicinus]